MNGETLLLLVKYSFKTQIPCHKSEINKFIIIIADKESKENRKEKFFLSMEKEKFFFAPETFQ